MSLECAHTRPDENDSLEIFLNGIIAMERLIAGGRHWPNCASLTDEHCTFRNITAIWLIRST